MRLPQLFLALTLVILTAPAAQAAPKTPYDRATDPFVAELNRQCPGRDLQDLPHGDLNLVMEGFFDRLPKPRQRSLARDMRHACRHTIAGLGCANTTSLLGYERMGLLPKFTADVCATRWTCKAFADCTQTQP